MNPVVIWILKFIGIAVSVAIGDACWTKYIVYTNDGKALRAAFWSSAIVLCTFLSIYGFIEDRRFIFACIIGAFLGTYFTVKNHNFKSKN